MNSNLLQKWIKYPESLDESSLSILKSQIALYPYFQTLYLLYLQNLHTLKCTDRDKEVHKMALHVADRQVLYYLIEQKPQSTEQTNTINPATLQKDKKRPTADRTLSLINSFLASRPQEETLAENETGYTIDYLTYLLQNDETDTQERKTEIPDMRGQDLIDNFLNNPKSKTNMDYSTSGKKESQKLENEDYTQEPLTDVANTDLDDSYFTETLAKIYIKQHRYDKALEIIRKLSLNYPKKNTYFAAQIKALEELITNAKSK